MNLSTKKVIAREILLFFLLLLLIGAAYLASYSYRAYEQYRSDQISKELSELLGQKINYPASPEWSLEGEFSLNKEIRDKKRAIQVNSSSLLSLKDLKDFTVKFALVCLTLLYPVRLIYYTLAWSIRTLRST